MAFRDFAVGCVGHFLIAVAAVALLAGTAHYWGVSGRLVFMIVLVVIFVVSVLIPYKKKKKQ
jgi:hypothetical protein